jgi:hypothetical protein
LGFGNLATFQNSACKLIAKRQSSSVNPKVVVDCQGTQRSDIFGSNSTSIAPTHNIQGLDIIFAGSNNGIIKAYFSAAAIAENVNVVSAASALQFYSSATTESVCPTLVATLFTSNAIAGDSANESRFVRLKRSKHLTSGPIAQNNRATYLIFVDPDFTAGIPINYGPSASGNYQSGLDIRYSYNLKTFNETGSPITGATIRFKRSDNAVTTLITTDSGIPEQELICRQAPNTPGNSRTAGTLTTFTWEVQGRSYGHTQSVEIYSSGPITSPQIKSITMISDPNISLTQNQALALPGIVLDFVAKTIVMDGQSASNLYHYYKTKISDAVNFDTPQFMTIAGGVLAIAGGWSLQINGGNLSGSSTINSIVVGGLFALSIGAVNTILVTDSVKTYYPAIALTGFPRVPNLNGLTPSPVLGVKNNRTGIWEKYSISNGEISINLSALGVAGDTFSLIGDANGYQRTVVVTLPVSFQGAYDFSGLFIQRLDSSGGPICGKGIPSEMAKVTYDSTTQTIELGPGKITFNSFCDKLESIFNTETSIADWDSTVIRGLFFERNPYAATVHIPSPIKINSLPGLTSSPVFTDFIAIESGNPSGDPFGHVGVEVRVIPVKVVSDPNPLLQSLTPNLALIPALL